MDEFSPRTRKKLGPEALFNWAVKALGRRFYTEAELRQRLAQRAANDDDVPATIKRLQGVGYLDDARAAEAHAYVRRELDRLGRRRVLSELEQRGVSAEIAEKTVDEAYAEVNETEQIRDFLKRKLGRKAGEPIEDRKTLVRLYAGMHRAGYSSAGITAELRRLSPDADWLDELPDE